MFISNQHLTFTFHFINCRSTALPPPPIPPPLLKNVFDWLHGDHVFGHCCRFSQTAGQLPTQRRIGFNSIDVSMNPVATSFSLSICFFFVFFICYCLIWFHLMAKVTNAVLRPLVFFPNRITQKWNKCPSWPLDHFSKPSPIRFIQQRFKTNVDLCPNLTKLKAQCYINQISKLIKTKWIKRRWRDTRRAIGINPNQIRDPFRDKNGEI